MNGSYDRVKNLEIAVKGKVTEAKLLSSDDVRPYTYFNESALDVTVGKKSLKLSLPTHSVASIRIALP